jgi:hypothetical protein
MTRHVRFIVADPYGLWAEGDTATDLGRESSHPDAPDIYLFGLAKQIIALHDPWNRGLVVTLADPKCGFCHGEAVHNASHWIGGRRRVAPCPRCGGIP